MTRRYLALSATLLALAGVTSASGQAVPLADPIPGAIPLSRVAVSLQPVAVGLAAPILLETSGAGDARLFVVDQTGKVLVIKRGVIQPTPLLDISGVMAQLPPTNPGDPQGLNPGYDERGLLGLAFHPDFRVPGRPGSRAFYTYHSVPPIRAADFPAPAYPGATVVPAGQMAIAEWRVSRANPDVVDPSSFRELLRLDKPQNNHNGGTLAFGPDGLLYASVGDGGAGNDSGPGHNPYVGNGQDLTSILGKILRIDPIHPSLTANRVGAVSANGQYRIPASNPFVPFPGVVKEVYALGFRNPFRFSFDRVGGDLIVGDVGQNNVEEVDIVRKGGDYGWRIKEGTFLFNPADGTVSTDRAPNPFFVDPVVQYDHNQPRGPSPSAILGGYVYRGNAIRALRGKYVFADFSGIVFAADLKAKTIERLLPDVGFSIKGVGQDNAGELYILGSTNPGLSGNLGMILALRPN